MITEDYVSFETAKLLKKKGFEGDCIMNYIDNELINVYDYDYPSTYELENTGDDVVDAPTLHMVMKWLREVYKISIEVFYFTSNSDSGAWAFEIIKLPSGATVYGEYDKKNYEEACEAAIRYCLEHLI